MASDPLALMRNLVNEWEKLVNGRGVELLAKPEVVQAMQGMTSVGLQAQGATQEWMAKALSAANLPSKADVEALAVRLTAIEAGLARIEASLPGAGIRDGAQEPKRPEPRRTRKPAS